MSMLMGIATVAFANLIVFIMLVLMAWPMVTALVAEPGLLIKGADNMMASRKCDKNIHKCTYVSIVFNVFCICISIHKKTQYYHYNE